VPIPHLPTGSRARVFARIVDQLTTDATLSRVVKTWTHGVASRGGGQTVSPNAATATHVRLAPRLGPAEWYSPDAQLGDLLIHVDILAAGAATAGPDMIDVLNLWEAIEAAVYPPGDDAKRLAFQQALRDAGSHTGQVEFSQPASFAGVDGETERPIARGVMRIDVKRAFNP
jgi:hypothetical protein